MGAHSTVKKLNTKWIDKADSTKNNFDQFIFYWIAFNAFYSYRTGQSNDRRALKKISADNYMISAYNELVENDPRPLTLLKNLTPPVRDASDENSSPISIKTNNLSEVLTVLYQIRCNLFHGDKGESEQRDKQVIRASLPMLRALVKKFSAFL